MIAHDGGQVQPGQRAVQDDGREAVERQFHDLGAVDVRVRGADDQARKAGGLGVLKEKIFGVLILKGVKDVKNGVPFPHFLLQCGRDVVEKLGLVGGKKEADMPDDRLGPDGELVLIQDLGPPVLGQKGAFALDPADQPLLFQILERAFGAGPADPEFDGQLIFGGKLKVRIVLLLFHQFKQIFLDDPVHRLFYGLHAVIISRRQISNQFVCFK